TKPTATKKVEPPKEPVAQKPIQRLSPEALKGGGTINPAEILKQGLMPSVPPPAEVADDEEGGDAKGGKVRPGQVTGRDKRHAARNARAEARKGRRETEIQGGRAVLTADLDDRPAKSRRRGELKKRPKGPTQPRK